MDDNDLPMLWAVSSGFEGEEDEQPITAITGLRCWLSSVYCDNLNDCRNAQREVEMWAQWATLGILSDSSYHSIWSCLSCLLSDGTAIVQAVWILDVLCKDCFETESKIRRNKMHCIVLYIWQSQWLYFSTAGACFSVFVGVTNLPTWVT